MASVARDLTERERARARFRGLLEAAPVAIIAGDDRWRVALANAQAERLFGYPPGELVGRPVGDLFPGYVAAARAGRRPRFAADLAPGEVVALKLAARRRDGVEFFAEVSLTTIETDEGWLALAGVRDGTERELAAIVESSSDAIIGKTLDGVITSWNRGAEEMYGWTSGEMIGRSVSALVPSDRADELRRLLDAVADGERVDHLETQRLRRDGSRFDVSLSISPIHEHPGPHVRLLVADNGVGMPREVADRAFDPFFTTKPAGQGTGLGLATVYGIVKRAGGTISLYCEPGHGTTCRIHLPAAPGTERPPPRAAATGVQGGRGERVLVVEDETALREIAARILHAGGYTVSHTGSPTEALSLIEHDDAVDLLLTDVVMPEMLGTELAVRAAEIRPDLPILYMSGNIDPLVGARYQISDPELIVQKPFSPEDLLARVRDTLNRATR